MDKKLLLITILFISIKSISQNDSIAFYGKIHNALGVLPSAHIINKSTKKATYSNENGEFKIFVKVNDSLKFTSIGYKTDFLIIKPTHLSIKETKIILKKEIYELDEVEIKNHNLTGSLSLDFKQTPKDKKAEALANTMDFSKINMKAKTKDDYIDRHVRPHIVETDPTKMVGIFGVSTKKNISGNGNSSKKLRTLKEDLTFKESFPAKLLTHFGEDFFFKDLKIPKEKYTHFITYCSYLGIEELYKENNLLAIIKILRKEQIEYLKIIKKE